MDSKPCAVETRRTLYIEKEWGNIEIEVAPCEDKQKGQVISILVWGEAKVLVPVEMVELLAKALLQCKQEIEESS